MSWPGLRRDQLHNPLAYVVEEDLRAFRGLKQRHAAELESWRRRDKKAGRPALRPSTWVLMALAAPLRSLRPGVDGCGLQLAARAYGPIVGCTERGITQAFAQAIKQGLMERRPRDVAHQWQGKRRFARADICSVLYLTPAGLARLEAVQGKARRLVIRVARNFTRVLPAYGLMWKLLEQLRGKFSLVAARLSPQKNHFRPTALKRYRKRSDKREERGSPVGNASARGSLWRKPASRVPGTGPPLAGMGDDRARLFELFRRGELTPANAWPDLWRPLRKFEPRTRQHWWLIRLYKETIAEFSWIEEPSARQLELADTWTRTWPKVDHWNSPETKAWLAVGGRST